MTQGLARKSFQSGQRINAASAMPVQLLLGWLLPLRIGFYVVKPPSLAVKIAQLAGSRASASHGSVLPLSSRRRPGPGGPIRVPAGFPPPAIALRRNTPNCEWQVVCCPLCHAYVASLVAQVPLVPGDFVPVASLGPTLGSSEHQVDTQRHHEDFYAKIVRL